MGFMERSDVDAEHFVDAVHEVVYRAAARQVLELLEDPPGRNPSPQLVSLSAWSRSLDRSDGEQLAAVVRMAVDHAVFGFLAVLDGVRPIGSQADPVLQIDGQDVTEGRNLHELFQIRVDEQT